jgi:hypothetical protein
MGFDLTPFGYLMVPATLLIAGLYPRWLLPWTFVFAPFQAASVLNIYLGGYPIGVQPGYFAAGCFIVVLFLKLLNRGYASFPRGLAYVCTPLFVFLAYVTLGAVLLPQVFEDAIEVIPPREGVEGRFVPLQLSMTNVSQTLYVIFLAVFLVAVALDVANFGRRRSIKYYLIPYLIGGCLVALIGFYQLGAEYFGLPYPYGLLYSNFYAQNYSQVVGEVKRLSSTFTEPAQASYYLVGVFFFTVWCYLFTRTSKLILPTCLLSGTALLLTTSTTAYVAMSVMWLVMMWQVIRRRRLSYRVTRLAIVLIPIFVLAFVALYSIGGSETVRSTIEASIFDKPESESYEVRTESAFHSLTLLSPTGGFGVGWGSNRSSSLLFNMLANAGIWGTALLVWFGFRVYRYVSRTVSLSAIDQEPRHLVVAYGLSVLAMLVAGLTSEGDLTYVYLWLNLAVLIALTLYARKLPAETPYRALPAEEASIMSAAASRRTASTSNARRGGLFEARGGGRDGA